MPAAVANECHRPTAELEAILMTLYADDNLTDTMREVRANVARAYHDRTGRYFAARFYY